MSYTYQDRQSRLCGKVPCLLAFRQVVLEIKHLIPVIYTVRELTLNKYLISKVAELSFLVITKE